MKKLKEFLPEEWRSELPAKVLEVEISSVTSDSRQVSKGTIFIATRGEKQDGHQYLAQAQESGAVVLIGETPRPSGVTGPYIRVENAKLALARLAGEFYGNPSHGLLMVGVTGTSGKTTTTYLVEAILKAAGFVPGVIGTVNFRYKGKILESTHTTPGAVELQKLLAEMKADGVNAVVMEVSSHALKQSRVAGLAFDAAVFTNLSPEHMDFHPDMEDYYASKSILFKELTETALRCGKKPVASINLDDSYGKRLYLELQGKFPSVTQKRLGFSIEGEAEFSGSALEVDASGIRGQVGQVRVDSPLTAQFNVANILAAISIARGLGIQPDAIARGLAGLSVVPGRLERVPNSKGLNILVDYAHKPDALEKVLKSLRAIRREHRLLTVFGCGGDRDRTKRPVMGKLAVDLSDQVWVTSDNPRTEDPAQILKEVTAGAGSATNYKVEADRKKAIFDAIRAAKAGDIVLIAGKGHEDYQIIADPASAGGTRKIHFDDREVAREAVAKC
jgi:UDP-N-acetylmuramoyl-L-alanyl-D-glutamate--2,6-diaminopimelate ligase